jgi:hypothetical protein
MDPLPTKREQKFIFKELDALSGPGNFKFLKEVTKNKFYFLT